jgi:hypothetical protein
MHLNLRQIVAQTETMGELAGLGRMGRHMSLEGLHISGTEDAQESSMEVRIALFDVPLVHSRGLFKGFFMMDERVKRSPAPFRSWFDFLRYHGTGFHHERKSRH